MSLNIIIKGKWKTNRPILPVTKGKFKTTHPQGKRNDSLPVEAQYDKAELRKIADAAHFTNELKKQDESISNR